MSPSSRKAIVCWRELSGISHLVIFISASADRFVKNRHVISLLSQKPQDGGFQLYTAAPAVSTAIIPSKISFVEATVLPLAVDTAAVGLYDLRCVLYALHSAQSVLPTCRFTPV